MRLRLTACFFALVVLSAVLLAPKAGEEPVQLVTAGHTELAEAVEQKTWEAANHVRLEQAHAVYRSHVEAARRAQEARRQRQVVRVRAAAVNAPRAVEAPPVNHSGLPPILLRIRWCESRDSYTARNPRSTASGAWQWLDSSWRSYGYAARYGVPRAYLAAPWQQDEAALDMYQRSGTQPWLASKSCWS